MRLVRDIEVADDIAQGTFVRLWLADCADRWPQVPRAWLTAVVSNLATSGFGGPRWHGGGRTSSRARRATVGVHATADAEFGRTEEAVSTAIGRLSLIGARRF
jgi:DNA-directed RNA polymerase specialized sigma24 family protein